MNKIPMLILVILAAAGLAAAQQPAQAPAGATTGQPSRTIQVLTDVPTAQIIPTMRVIAASLGVECEFCHESNRTLNTEKKDVARKMMTMLRRRPPTSPAAFVARVTESRARWGSDRRSRQRSCVR